MFPTLPYLCGVAAAVYVAEPSSMLLPVLSRSGEKAVGLFRKSYHFSKSCTTFRHISYSQ